ncbi:MAG: protein of unknown function rane [Candidatus Binatus sp.]|nr:protein of unknown function rane [Candidatus Binatus sp.]
MKRPSYFFFRSSRGQIAVLYAGVAVALLGAVALGTDVCLMYHNWAKAQKAVDAAAVAGANYLSGLSFTNTIATGCTTQPDNARKVACTYATKNGLAVGNLTFTEPDISTIRIAYSKSDIPYNFGRVIGMGNYTISVTAVAKASLAIGQVNRGLFPVGLQCDTPCNVASLNPGQGVVFGKKFVGGLAPGNWQFLATDGTGNSVLGNAIQNGASGTWKVGDLISSEPGNSGGSSNVANGMQARLGTCPVIADPCSAGGGNPSNIPAGDPCLVVVPAVDYHGCTGSCDVTVSGFAEVYLETDSTGRAIDGCFVSAVAADTIASSTAPQLGAVVPPGLIQ